MTSVRRLSQNSVLYALGTTCQRAASFLLIPVYTSALGVSEYGALETLIVTVHLLVLLLNAGLSQAVLRFYSECADETEVMVMVRTSFVLVLGISISLFGLLLPFFGKIGLLLFKEEEFGQFIVLAFLWAIGGTLNLQLFAYYRARQDARTYVVLSVLVFSLLATLNIMFVRVLEWGLLGVFVGYLISVWSVNLLLVTKFWRHGRSISLRQAGKLAAFGFPLVFAALGWLILNSVDRYFLAHYRDLEEVGLYSLGYKVGLVLEVAVIGPFQLAWGPFVFGRAVENAQQPTKDFSRVLTYLLSVLGAVGIVIFLFSSQLAHWLGSGKFPQAAAVVPFVLVASAFTGIYYWAASMFHLRRKTVQLSAIVFSMAILSLLLNWAWVPTHGWVGAAVATVVTIGGTGILTLVLGKRLYRVSLEGRRIGKLTLALMVVIATSVMVPIPAGVMGWLARTGIVLLLPILLVALRFFEPSEIRFLFAFTDSITKRANWESGKTK